MAKFSKDAMPKMLCKAWFKTVHEVQEENNSEKQRLVSPRNQLKDKTRQRIR